MNKIYKVIWSKVKHCYVVVSELTKRDGKSASPTGLLGRKAAVLAVMALCGAGAVLPTMPVRAEYVIAVDQTTVGNNGFAMKWPGADEKPEEYLGSIGVGYPKDSKNMQMRFGLATGDTDYSDNKKTHDGIPVANEYKYRTALGRQFRNFGAGATSIGYFSKSVGTETTSLGYMAQTEEWLGTALGARTYSSGKGATAVGYHAVSINTQSTAIGNNAVAFDQATAVGNDTWALGKGSIAFGSDDTYLGSEYMDALPRPVIESVYKKVWAKDEPYHIFKDYLDPNNKDDYGQNAFNKAYTGAASIYSPTYAGGTAAIAIGARAIAPGSGSTAVGVLAMAMGARSTAIGTRAYVSEGAAGGLSMGEESRVLQTNGISVGNHTYSGDQGSVSYGYNSKAVGSGAVAVGHQAVASAELNKDAATKLDALLQYRITKNHTQDIQTIMQSSKNDPEAALEKVNPKIATYNDASHIIRVKNVVKKDEKGNISWANPEHTVPNFNTSILTRHMNIC